MTKITNYNLSGTKAKEIQTPKQWNIKVSPHLLAQAIRVYKNRKHFGNSKTKRRGEISLTTKKAHRQKGTGMARHGAKSAPIYVGGGKAHGPKGQKRILTLSKKMQKKALFMALSTKLEKDKIVALSGLQKAQKTKQAIKAIQAIIKDKKLNKNKVKFTLALSDDNKDSSKAFRNIANMSVLPFKNLNAFNIYFAGTLLVDSQALSTPKPSKPVQKKVNSNKITKSKK